MSWSRRWGALPGRDPSRARTEACPVDPTLPGCDSGPLQRLAFVVHELTEIGRELARRRRHGA